MGQRQVENMIVAFIGQRKINYPEALKERLKKIVENLIINENVDTFLFGSKSEFDTLCYEVVTELQAMHSSIRRVYVRAEREFISEEYRKYLLILYEFTYFPKAVQGAGALSYVKRNQAMIDKCDIVVAYYDDQYIPSTKTKSGTKMAVVYAIKNHKRLINLLQV